MSEKEPLLIRDTVGCRRTSTVEFPMFAILFSTSLTDAVTSNLLLYRTCHIDLHYNETKCKLLHMTNKTMEAKTLEAEVEAKTTLIIMIISVISGVTPAILSVFIGSWSDRHGRKPLIMLPLLGQIITSIFVITYTFLNSLSSWWFILCVLPYALMGGSGTIALGTTLFITDITNENNRSFRLSLLYGCGFLGVLFGSVTATYIYEAVGYTYLYVLSTVVYVFTLIYLWMCVDESLVQALAGGFRDLFDIKLVKITYDAVFKKRTKSIQTILLLLVTSFGLTMFCAAGLENMTYFFTRQQFQWLLKEYNVFSAVNTIIIVFGMFIGIAFLQKVCKMSDGVILMFSYISSIADAIVRCFARKSWHMYLGGTMSMLGGLSPPMIRSQVAKIVPRNEVAKMYSMITFVESILPVFSPLVFNTIYYKTLLVFPAAIYAVSAVLFTICLIFVTIAEVIYYRTLPIGELSF